MSLVAALFAHQPASGWMAVACLLLAAELASGNGRFAWPALATLGPALLAAAHVPLGLGAQALIFAALAGVAALAFEHEQRALRAAAPRLPPAHGLPTPTAGAQPPSRIERLARPRRPSSARDNTRQAARPTPTAEALKAARSRARAAAPQGDAKRAPTLVGRTGRTLGEFSNGLGRVWLDGAEWGAELARGEALPPDRDVKVLGVQGGVRLRVMAV